MSDSENSNAKKLDLGISQILERESAPESPTDTSARPDHTTSIVTLEDSAGGLENEFLQLAQAKNWGVLASKAEASIAAGDDIEARLWWVRAHLGAFSLPVSLLAAPFETVCRQLESAEAKEKHKPLIREIGAIILERLKDVGDRRQEYSVHLALNRLGVVEAERDALGSWGKIPLSPSASAEASAAPAATTPSREGGERRVSGIGGLGIIIALLSISGAGGGVAWYLMSHEPQTTLSSDPFVTHEVAPQVLTPEVAPKDLSSGLNALMYSMTSEPKAADAPRAPESAASVSSVPTTPPVVMGSVSGLDRETKPSSAKIDTSGPVEGPEFQRGVERNRPSPPKLPSLGNDAPPSRASDPRPEQPPRMDGDVKSVIARTDVYASPSYYARPIGRLERGDRVSVEGRVGQWLRIRSRRGKPGFVLAQDVGDIDDFRADR